MKVGGIGGKKVNPRSQPEAAGGKPSRSELVSILARPADGGKVVLLNVPRSVALKVKIGTSLSFSASTEQKFTVVDNKIHAALPVQSPQSPQTPQISLHSRGEEEEGNLVRKLSGGSDETTEKKMLSLIRILCWRGKLRIRLLNSTLTKIRKSRNFG